MSAKHSVGSRVVLLTILLGFFAISAAPVADAHAVLESSSPADQSVLPKSPARVEVTFSESVTLLVGSLRVFDSSGRQVQEGVPRQDRSGRTVSVRLESNLPVGSYAVAWKVISADTHPVHGGFVFSFGRSGGVGDLDQYLSSTNSLGWEAAGDVLRTISYLGVFIVVGAAVFVSFVERRDETGRRRGTTLAMIGLAAVLAEVLSLPVEAALATGEGPGQLFAPGVFAQVIGQGTVLTIAGVAVAVVAALATFLVGHGQKKWTSVTALVLAAAAYAASGHTRTTDPVVLVVVVDMVHVAAGAVWVGGVAMLVVRTWRRAREGSDPRVAAEEVARFSGLATVAIVAVGVAGVALAWFEVGSWKGLFTTGYGQLVLVKIGLVVVLAAVGAFNHFRLVPLLRRRPDHRSAWGYLRRAVRIEALAFVAVLAVSGVLVNAIPSRTEIARQRVYSSTLQVGSQSANLVIDPVRVGPAALHIYLLDAQGRADSRQLAVSVELYQPRLGIGPIDHELRRAGPGHYLTNGTLFSVTGDWQVTLRVRVDEFTEQTATFRVAVKG